MVSPSLYLKFAKDIEPEIFENKTPKFHIDIINFIEGKGQFKAVATFRGSAKTTLINKIYILARLYFYAEPFIIVISVNETKAKLFLEAIKNSVDRANTKGYALSRGKIWNNDRIEVIVNRGKKDKNGKNLEKSCHIISLSAGQDPRGYNIDNQRPTLLLIDDLESKEGKYPVISKTSRQKLRSWFYADLLPTLHPTRGKAVILGTIIHEDSILNNIINSKYDEQEQTEKHEIDKWQYIKIAILENGISTWPSRFPVKKIKSIQNKLISAGLANEFYQEYMCRAIDPEKAIFKRDYFKYFKCVEYDLNAPLTTVCITDAVNTRHIKISKAKNILFGNERIALSECKIFTTVDLASSSGRDRTAIVTSAIDRQNRIFVLDITSGHWTPFEKSVELIKVYLTFLPFKIGMEKAGMQNDFFYTIDTIQKLSGVRFPIDGLSHKGVTN